MRQAWAHRNFHGISPWSPSDPALPTPRQNQWLPRESARCHFFNDPIVHHSRGGIFHSFSEWFKTRNKSFMAASSVGKCPRAALEKSRFATRTLGPEAFRVASSASTDRSLVGGQL